jgi:hypothetical protein
MGAYAYSARAEPASSPIERAVPGADLPVASLSIRFQFEPVGRTMSRASRDDMVVISMGLNALLESVRQTEKWLRGQGDSVALRRTKQLADAIRTTRRKFLEPTDVDFPAAEALIVVEGLREAARHCQEGQIRLTSPMPSPAY